MSVMLAIIATLTIGLSCLRFGWNSLISLGLFGTYIYSFPGFIGLTLPFHQTLGERGIFAELSSETLIGLCIAWLVLLLFTAVAPVPNRSTSPQAKVTDPRWNLYLTACVLLAVFGFLVITAASGLMFFLKPRSEIDSGLVMLLWRWLLVFGIVMAIKLKRWWSALLFTSGLTVYFIAGDRTMLAISIASLLLMAGMVGERRKTIPPLIYLLGGAAAFIFLTIGKPVYLAIKSQSVEDIDLFLNFEAIMWAILSLEPVVTINLLDYSVSRSLSMPLADFLVSVFGNLLIMPSLFGIDTNYFNTFFTQEMPAALGFGVAGSYYAHGYVVFGFFGIGMFAAIFFVMIYAIERKIEKSVGLSKLIFLIIGATVAVYAHRNGIDNLFSFLRQILIVAFVMWLLVRILRILPLRRRNNIRGEY